MKKKMIIIGITMNAAGTEKSFLSFAEKIDYNKYDVELLLAKREGAFLHLVPPQIKVTEMGGYGEIFTISKSNAVSIIKKLYLRKNPLFALSLLPDIINMKRGEPYRTYAAHRIWLRLMKKMPMHSGDYDVAIAYWGDRTMFYAVDKIRAKKKIAWLHFDYDEPPREDAVYLPYFSRCDRMVTVSKAIENSLGERFPQLCGKIETIENFINKREIREKAKEPCGYRDGFSGKALLSVGRLCEQKGFDLAIPAVARLYREGENIHYYIIGEGDAAYEAKLRALTSEAGGCVTLLSRTENPYKFMARCDVYLQPSRHEGKPITVEEAKVLGKPLCVTDYRSACEQVEGVKNAVVCDISEDGIYNGMKEILRRI